VVPINGRARCAFQKEVAAAALSGSEPCFLVPVVVRLDYRITDRPISREIALSHFTFETSGSIRKNLKKS
jgi:hypothetical protein